VSYPASSSSTFPNRIHSRVSPLVAALIPRWELRIDDVPLRICPPPLGVRGDVVSRPRSERLGQDREVLRRTPGARSTGASSMGGLNQVCDARSFDERFLSGRVQAGSGGASIMVPRGGLQFFARRSNVPLNDTIGDSCECIHAAKDPGYNRTTLYSTPTGSMINRSAGGPAWRDCGRPSDVDFAESQHALSKFSAQME